MKGCRPVNFLYKSTAGCQGLRRGKQKNQYFDVLTQYNPFVSGLVLDLSVETIIPPCSHSRSLTIIVVFLAGCSVLDLKKE